jgi:hypothetical protein
MSVSERTPVRGRAARDQDRDVQTHASSGLHTSRQTPYSQVNRKRQERMLHSTDRSVW